jgi:hypothetical protein
MDCAWFGVGRSLVVQQRSLAAAMTDDVSANSAVPPAAIARRRDD